jgi:hypothetical protein
MIKSLQIVLAYNPMRPNKVCVWNKQLNTKVITPLRYYSTQIICMLQYNEFWLLFIYRLLACTSLTYLLCQVQPIFQQGEGENSDKQNTMDLYS